MKYNYQTYLNKVRGCFLGKNIGGTMGGPYEGKRELLNVTGYVTEKGEPLPNDDLDLQLVWLQALEDQGPMHINSEMLGKYWLSFIVPYWNEYGIGKCNMQAGFPPSVAGDMDNNIWKHSNGAWIRTEIWACLAPGAVDTAVRYAIEDAMVDHGMGEGTYAAIFVAALESAAFIVNDIRELIEIGLSKVDECSRLHSTIELVIKEYDKGTDYRDVRNMVVELNKDIGDGWFQAPNNIAFCVIGLLYGEGDFKKSMLTAINCGDDTDCTGATVGSIMGIMYGEENIPQDWKEYIGDRILTISINRAIRPRTPGTITELVNRVSRQAQYVLTSNFEPIELVNEESEIPDSFVSNLKKEFGLDDERDAIRDLKFAMKPLTFRTKAEPLTVVVRYLDGVQAEKGKETRLSVMFINDIKEFGNAGRRARFEIIAPVGYSVGNGNGNVYVPCRTPMTKMAHTDEIIITLLPGEASGTSDTVLLKVSVTDRGSENYIPIKFIRG